MKKTHQSRLTGGTWISRQLVHDIGAAIILSILGWAAVNLVFSL